MTHRRYVPYSHAHYAGNLVDGAYALGLFGDVATEVCIRTDGDEGLFAGYADVRFHAPIHAGDVVEVPPEVLPAEALPLLFVSSEVDRKRRPLAFLPMEIESLRVEEVGLGHGATGLRARMVAEAAFS